MSLLWTHHHDLSVVAKHQSEPNVIPLAKIGAEAALPAVGGERRARKATLTVHQAVHAEQLGGRLQLIVRVLLADSNQPATYIPTIASP